MRAASSVASTGSSRSGSTPRVPREVADGVRDLRPGRRHEVVEEPRDESRSSVVQARERALEMLLDDPLGAAELRQRRRAQHVRATLALDLPEPLAARAGGTAPRRGARARPRRRARGRRGAARSGPPRPGRARPRRALLGDDLGPAELGVGRKRALDRRRARPRGSGGRAAGRSRRGPGRRRLKASRSASASSRTPSRTCTGRSARSARPRARRRAGRRRGRGRGSTPRSGRGSR